jgi:transposase
MAQIVKDTGYIERTIYGIQKKAKDRGYNPSKDTKILLHYVEDAPRVGRPKKATPELEEEVIKTISKNSTTRELSTAKIAEIVAPLAKGGTISACTIHRILRRRGYKPCKPTRNQGLHKKQNLLSLSGVLITRIRR